MQGFNYHTPASIGDAAKAAAVADAKIVAGGQSLARGDEARPEQRRRRWSISAASPS